MPLNHDRPFLAVNIALLTVSDTRNEADDRSGNTLFERAAEAGHKVVARKIIRDEFAEIVAQLKAWIADPEIDVVISTGGTGVTGRDVTPEAFHSVYEKEIAGFGELFRWKSYEKIGTSTMQSRATAGVAGGTYLFALPGSPGAAIWSSSCRGCRNISAAELRQHHVLDLFIGSAQNSDHGRHGKPIPA